MLTISVGESIERFDEGTNKFLPSLPAETVVLEHSLVSLSKWEALFKKPFLDGKTKTTPETHAYFGCMNLSPDVSPDLFTRLSNDDVKAIADYIDDSQTATWFKPNPNARPNHEIITGEVIYYWMFAHSIPIEAEGWHLNRLMTLIKVCNEKNKPPARQSKMGQRDMAAQRRALNEQRLAAGNTTG